MKTIGIIIAIITIINTVTIITKNSDDIFAILGLFGFAIVGIIYLYFI